MRQLMSKTGLTEKELREKTVYRKQLSDAQKIFPSSTKSEKYLKAELKKVTTELKLAKEHPKVIKKFKEVIDLKRKNRELPNFLV